MDSGLAAPRRPGMTTVGIANDYRNDSLPQTPHRLDPAGAVAVRAAADRADPAADVMAPGLQLHRQGAASDAAEFRHAVLRSGFPRSAAHHRDHRVFLGVDLLRGR